MSNLEDLFDKGLRTFLKPLTPFWEDSSVTGIFVNAPQDIWVERYGTLEQADVDFSTEQLYQAIRHIAQLSGVLISEENPQLHTMLPDGTEISIVLPPISRSGPVLAIHKATSRDRTLDELVEEGVLSRASGEFLLASLLAQQSMMIVGPPGSGKATLIRALVQYIPANERIVSIEQSTSQVFQHPHILHFALPSSDHRSDGRAKVSQTLLRALSSIRPNRILVERMGARSTLELMQVFRTGYPGSLATVRAYEPVHALQRIEAQCLSTQMDLPLKSLRAQLASTFQLAVVCQRTPQGSSHVSDIMQLLPLDKEGAYQLLPLFQREATSSPNETHNWEPGLLLPTGAIPSSWPILQRLGFRTIDRAFFHPDNYDAYGDRDETKTTPSEAIVGQPLTTGTSLETTPATIDTPALTNLLEQLIAKGSAAQEVHVEPDAPASTPPDAVATKEPVTRPVETPVEASVEDSQEVDITAQSPAASQPTPPPDTKATPAPSIPAPKAAEESFPFLASEEDEDPTPAPKAELAPPMPSEEANDALLLGDGVLEPIQLDDTSRQSPIPKQTVVSTPLQEDDLLQETANPLEGNSFSLSSHELVDSPFHQPDPPPQAKSPNVHQSTTVIAPVDPAASRRPAEEPRQPDWDNDPTYNPVGHHPATTQSPPLSVPTAQVPPVQINEDTSQILDLSDIIVDDLPNLVSEEDFRRVEEELRQQSPVRQKDPSTDMSMPQTGGPATRGGMLPAEEIPTSSNANAYLYNDEEPTQTGTGLQGGAPKPPSTPMSRVPPPSTPPPTTPRRGNVPPPHTPARSVVVRRGRRTGVYDIGSFDVQETESTSIRARPPSVPKATRSKPDPAVRNQHPPSVEVPLSNNLSTEATVIRGRPVSPIKKK